MGLLSWWRGDGKKTHSQPAPPPPPPPPSNPKAAAAAAEEEVVGMNGAEEVPRSRQKVGNITIFEFGSVAATADKVTLAGYCPVSDDLQPCRWEILPAAAADSPQFRVAF